MQKDALYYPHISLSDSSLIKSMALFYDNIYRIVPKDIIPKDSPDLKPLLEEGSVGNKINPSDYSREASENFLSKIDNWDAAALSHDIEDVDQISRLHIDKTDVRVRALFKEAGFHEEHDWMSIPIELESNYMLYLATEISKKNNLSLITSDWGAWTGTNYFNLNGKFGDCILPYDNDSTHIDDPFALFSLIVGEITPINISEISAEEILIFRTKRADEISNLRKSIYDLRSELMQIESHDIKLDKIAWKIKELARAKKDYQESADNIKVKGWSGYCLLGLTASVALGPLLRVPTASTISLGIATLALGGINYITHSKEELKKLNKENPVSCLVDIERNFKSYTSARGGGDVNFHAYNCMEEYIND